MGTFIGEEQVVVVLAQLLDVVRKASVGLSLGSQGVLAQEGALVLLDGLAGGDEDRLAAEAVAKV